METSEKRRELDWLLSEKFMAKFKVILITKIFDEKLNFKGLSLTISK